MIRWRTVVCCCTAVLLLLSNQVQQANSQDNAAFTKPITQLVNDLSTKFSNIATQNLGVDALEVRVEQLFDVDHTWQDIELTSKSEACWLYTVCVFELNVSFCCNDKRAFLTSLQV